MSACLKYRQERDWIKADQEPVKQKWGNPHSVFNRVPPAYFSDRRKLNIKLCIICLTRSLSIVFQRGRKAGSHCSTVTTWMCERMVNQTMKETPGKLHEHQGWGWNMVGNKEQGGMIVGAIVQRLQKKDNRTAERRSQAGEDLLFATLRENKCEAGFPNHHCLYETNFKSQTKVLRVLHATVYILVVTASKHKKICLFKLLKYSTQFHIWKQKNMKICCHEFVKNKIARSFYFISNTNLIIWEGLESFKENTCQTNKRRQFHCFIRIPVQTNYVLSTFKQKTIQ